MDVYLARATLGSIMIPVLPNPATPGETRQRRQDRLFLSLRTSSMDDVVTELWLNQTVSLLVRVRWAATNRSPVVLPLKCRCLSALSSKLSASMRASGQVLRVRQFFCRARQRLAKWAGSSRGARRRYHQISVPVNKMITAIACQAYSIGIRLIVTSNSSVCLAKARSWRSAFWAPSAVRQRATRQSTPAGRLMAGIARPG